jgi:hypothetical protein
MPKHYLGYPRSGGSDGDAALSEIRAFDTALRGNRYGDAEAGTLGHADQVARDIADIERAAAALRKAQPALETWTAASNDDASAMLPRKPRQVWLMIGLLWLSTALATAGAVAAIARFAG